MSLRLGPVAVAHAARAGEPRTSALAQAFDHRGDDHVARQAVTLGNEQDAGAVGLHGVDGSQQT